MKKRKGYVDLVEEWDKLWAGVIELSQEYGERIVFIGGVAIYLHTREGAAPETFLERSHDGDFFISLADFADLRDHEEVTANRRLFKYQIIKNGLEFDVYLENQAHLRVPFQDLYAASEVADGIRVASLEHLLVLKLDAFSDRRASAKGRKDERDVIRIIYLMSQEGYDAELLEPYWTSEMTRLLELVEKGREFISLARGNAHEARQLRETYRATARKLGAKVPKRDPIRRARRTR
jgi:hypothetical protein